MDWQRHKQRNQAALHYGREFGVPPLVAQVLLNRGINGLDVMNRFLEPELSHLADPFTMKGMERAVRRVRRAVFNGERIHIHGDYDVDGISATAVVYRALQLLGGNVHYHIQNRNDAGVGLTMEALDSVHKPKSPRVIITVDCGTGNVQEIAKAQDAGIDVVVIDHHEPGSRLPNACAVLNPRQPSCSYEFKDLAAVGLAYQFVSALDQFLRNDSPEYESFRPEHLLDLVALGTVADVVPLVSENRILASKGLELIRAARRPGICALLSSSGVISESDDTDLDDTVTTRTIGHRLAPRLNAAGRMSDANRCVELLTTDAFGRAVQIAAELETINTERQETERANLERALERAKENVDDGDVMLVLADRKWHPGVVGILASRLMDQFQRPALVAAIDNTGIAKGSIRCPRSYRILDALDECRHLVETYGGHQVAAGVTLKEENLEKLREALNEVVRRHRQEDNASEGRPLAIDATISLDDLDCETLEQLERIAPFGAGNPEPVFEVRDVTTSGVRSIGVNSLRLRIRDDATQLDAVAFGLGDRAQEFRSRVNLAVVPRLSRNADDRTEIEVRVVDVRPSSRSTA